MSAAAVTAIAGAITVNVIVSSSNSAAVTAFAGAVTVNVIVSSSSSAAVTVFAGAVTVNVIVRACECYYGYCDCRCEYPNRYLVSTVIVI